MKIAVTSANGKLGTSIIKNLIKEVGKENVIGIARTPEKVKKIGIEVRKGNYNNKEEFDLALQGIDKVMLLSGMAEPQQRIQQHRNVINAAIKNNVKKIVYTSIIGSEENNAFSPIVQSNRQTEKDVINSGMEWSIGRNGIYIEPDLEYLETYIKEGEVRNCADKGLCTYTSRNELGVAYTKMIVDKGHNGQTYNLVGNGITQNQLVDFINEVYETKLKYNAISFEEYLTERKTELGDFLGTVIAGIYQGIRDGANDVTSDFEKITGRKHKSALGMMKIYKK